MWYHGETYSIEVCKWNQKVEQITFMIIQLDTKYYQLLLKNVNWQRTQTKTWNS